MAAILAMDGEHASLPNHQNLALARPAILSRRDRRRMKAARNPAATLLSCPHNHHPDWHDRFTRKYRVAWRVAFREVREKGCVPLITITVGRAA